MILNLIKLGIKILLKTYFENIIINRVEIFSENNKFQGKIEKFIIEAEQILYKGLSFDYGKIEGFDINMDFNNEIRFINIKDFNAKTTLYITEENLENIINNRNFIEMNSNLKDLIFKNNHIDEITFKNGMILINFSNNEIHSERIYKLNFEDNNLILNDINSNKNVLIPFDQNIIFDSLIISKNYLKVKITSVVKFDN